MKLRAEYKQMPTFTARSGQNQWNSGCLRKIWNAASANAFARAASPSCASKSIAAQRLCPRAVPRIKSDRHFVLGSARDGVPSPRNSFFDVRGLRFNKSRRAVWITVHVQEFVGRIVVSHQITEPHELFSGPDPVRRVPSPIRMAFGAKPLRSSIDRYGAHAKSIAEHAPHRASTSSGPSAFF